jgi:repressor LexA
LTAVNAYSKIISHLKKGTCMEGLTEKQEEVLAFIKEHLDDLGRPPTLMEICDEFQWTSPNAAASHLRFLELKGAIKIDKGVTRGIRVL